MRIRMLFLAVATLGTWCGHGAADGPPRIEYAPVTITKSQPKTRVYGGEGKQAVLT